jgi:hypothetical protein
MRRQCSLTRKQHAHRLRNNCDHWVGSGFTGREYGWGGGGAPSRLGALGVRVWFTLRDVSVVGVKLGLSREQNSTPDGDGLTLEPCTDSGNQFLQAQPRWHLEQV